MEIPNNWTFKNTSIANNFEKHVREQLPWYDLVTNAISHIIKNYIPENGILYDIGASTGNISKSIKDIADNRNLKIINIEESNEMLKKFNGIGEILNKNALDIKYKNFDVCVMMLTLMFFPVEKRKQFLINLCNKVKIGGCIILVDKVSIESSYLSTVLSRLTIVGKVSTGTSYEDIVKKELSLSGVQRPLPYNFLDSIPLKYTQFFKFGEFSGWIIERNE